MDQSGNFLKAICSWIHLVCGASLAASADAQTLPLLPGYQELRTGGNTSLVSFTREFEVTPKYAAAQLEFQFGFGTEETNAPGLFGDAFSITFGGTNTPLALIVTTDASGTQWAPPNRGGLPLEQAQITRNEIVFDQGRGEFGLAFAYKVTIPLALIVGPGPATLFLDLFDNENELNSLAYFGQASLRISSTNRLGGPGLMSAATPAGPFAYETDYETNATQQTVTLPRVPRARFYQLSAEASCRFLPMRADGRDFVFPYEFLQPMVELEWSSDLNASWRRVTNAVVNLTDKSVQAPWDSSARFYRLSGNLRTRIVTFEQQGPTLVIHFDYQPARVTLQSSAQPGGPYALEQNARHDASAQLFRLPRGGDMLFFRFSPDDPRELVSARLVGDRIVCAFRLREQASSNTADNHL